VPYLLRGALIEYGANLIGPIPNVVIFQINPESLTRTLNIPPRPAGANAREQSRAGEKTFESISLKAHFSAADMLKDQKFLAKTFGIGPQLCALEKMVHPTAKGGGLLGAALDAVGGALGLGGGSGGDPPTQPIPREKYPQVLFIWGLTRVHPVTIDSLKIAEVEYDHLLNAVDACSDDWVAKGAEEYTTLAKDAQAVANLANTAEQIVELIPF
jgi:hypothetical protein